MSANGKHSGNGNGKGNGFNHHRKHATSYKAVAPVSNVSLVTGATGFVGSYLVRRLLEEGDTVYFLLRKESRDRAYDMMKKLGREVPGSRDNLHVVHGNILNEGIANPERDREILKDSVDYVWHLGGAGSITASRRQSLGLNWRGTVNMLRFASEIKNLRRFNYLSTVLVSGDYRGVWSEEMLSEKQRFYDEYSRTKHLAELEARRFSTSLPISIFRPGVVVGDSKTGYIPSLCGPYYLLKIMCSLKKRGIKTPLPVAPFSKKSLLNAAPVDFVANAMADIGKGDGTEDRTYHLTDPEPMTIFDFFEAACEYMKIPGPKWSLPMQGLVDSVLKTPILSSVMRKTGNWAGLPLETLSHATEVKYDTANASKALGDKKCPGAREYLNVMVDFASNRIASEWSN